MSKSFFPRINLSIYSVIIALIFAIGYYLFIEKPVKESRLTYSIKDSEYDKYSLLKSESLMIHNVKLYISPNYESISDTLTDKGIRRFELKKYAIGDIPNEELNQAYFIDKYGLPVPELIRDLDFGQSKAIGKSIGLAILITIIILLGAYAIKLVSGKRKGQSSDK